MANPLMITDEEYNQICKGKTLSTVKAALISQLRELNTIDDLATGSFNVFRIFNTIKHKTEQKQLEKAGV